MASESPQQCITLHVKPTAGGQKVEINCEPTITVLELKEKVASQNQMPAAEQRLIFKGQIMKDDRTIDSYGQSPKAPPSLRGLSDSQLLRADRLALSHLQPPGIGNESVLHLVRGRPAAGRWVLTLRTREHTSCPNAYGSKHEPSCSSAGPLAPA